MQCACETTPGVGGIVALCGAHAEVVSRAVEAERASCALVIDTLIADCGVEARNHRAESKEAEAKHEEALAEDLRVAAQLIRGRAQQ